MFRRGVRFFSIVGKENPAIEESTRSYWNKVADWYLKYNYDSSNKIYRSMAPFLNLSSASSVLDAGCGAGNSVSILKEFSGPQTRFTLVDISDALISRAKELAPEAEVHRENAESLSFKANSFDSYVSNGLIEIVLNPEWVLNEAFRVLKPGGHISFSIYGRMGICNTIRLYKNIRNRLNPKKKANEPRFELSDPERVIQLAKGVGFSDMTYFYKQYHFPQTSPEDIYGMYWDNPVLRDIATNEGKLAAFEEAIYEELEYLFYEKEEPLVYEALVICGRKPN